MLENLKESRQYLLKNKKVKKQNSESILKSLMLQTKRYLLNHYKKANKQKLRLPLDFKLKLTISAKKILNE